MLKVVHCLIFAALFAVIAASTSTDAYGQAQLAPGESLLDMEEFDLITLTAEAGGESVRVYPIDFPIELSQLINLAIVNWKLRC